MYIANELKKIINKENIEDFRNNFIDHLGEIVGRFFSDKAMFNFEDFSIHTLDEYVLKTNCHETIFATIYLEINQPLNYKPITKPKKSNQNKVQIPELYLTLSNIRNGLFEGFKNYFDSNNIVWQDKYSILLKSSVQLKDDKVEDYYFRLIPCLTHYNQNNIKGVMYYSNGDIEIDYPDIAYKNFKKKNKQTKDLFRQYVLIFKNILLKEKNIEQLPSEIIETILYNVPNELFVSDNKDDVLNVINFIRNNPLKEFKTMDEQDHAFSSLYKSMSIFYCKHIMKIIEKFFTIR